MKPPPFGAYRLVMIIVVISLALGGCISGRSSGTDPILQESTQTANSPVDERVRTNTPPPRPDLSGAEFSWALFTLDRPEFEALNRSIAAGAADGAAYFNSQGGINGARIEIVHVEINPEEEDPVEKVLSSLDEIEPLVVLMAAPIDEALFYELSQEDLPVLYFGFGGSTKSWTAVGVANVFWLVPPPDEQFAFFLSEVWKHWSRLRPSGNINQVRLGYLDSDPAFTALQTNPGLDAFLQSSSFEVVLRANIPSNLNASAANFLVDSISAGATGLYANTFPPGTAVLVNDLNTLAVSEFFAVGGSLWSIDADMDDYLLENASMQGYLLPLPVAWWTERDNPAIDLALAIHTANRRDVQELDAAYLLSLGAVDLGREALSAAIDRAGNGRVVGEDLLEQMAVLENYDVLGGLYRVDYSAGVRAPGFLRLWQLSSSGAWVPVGDGGQVPDLAVDSD